MPAENPVYDSGAEQLHYEGEQISARADETDLSLGAFVNEDNGVAGLINRGVERANKKKAEEAKKREESKARPFYTTSLSDIALDNPDKILHRRGIDADDFREPQ